jgi:hypothetical protein
MIKDECFLCEEKIFARNLCRKHYNQAYRLSRKDHFEIATDLLIIRRAYEIAMDHLRELGEGGMYPPGPDIGWIAE